MFCRLTFCPLSVFHGLENAASNLASLHQNLILYLKISVQKLSSYFVPVYSMGWEILNHLNSLPTSVHYHIQSLSVFSTGRKISHSTEVVPMFSISWKHSALPVIGHAFQNLKFLCSCTCTQFIWK